MNGRTYAAAALALLILTGAGAVVHEQQPPAPLQDDGWIDVMTYNVHHYWSVGTSGQHSLIRISDVIAEADPDLVGFQESDGTRAASGGLDGTRWLANTLGYHGVSGPTGRNGGLGVSLLSRWPVLANEWLPLPTVEGIDRGVLVATVGQPDGSLTVAVTHLARPERPEDRLRQAEALLAILQDRGPVILMGDFNTPPSLDEPPYRTLERGFDDAWVLAGMPRTSGATQLAAEDPARVDQIWARGTWQVDGCALHGDGRASDHRAVTCRMQRTDL